MDFYDMHTHSLHSPDAEFPVRDMVDEAKNKGLCGMCITDHCEINAFRQDRYDISSANAFEEIKRLQNEIKGFKLLNGIELGQMTQAQDDAFALVNTYDYDFIIASLHNVKDEEDFAWMKYPADFDAQGMLRRYYEELYLMSRFDCYNVLGHITYPLRYIVGYNHFTVDMTPFDEIIEEILKVVVQTGRGIEINTSEVTGGLRSTMPGERYLSMFTQLGGEIITLGSDAHRPADVARHFDIAAELVSSAGGKYICYFEQKKPVFQKLQ